MELIFEMSRTGRTAGSIPESDVPEVALGKIIDPALLRGEVDLPELSEVDIVRHYTRLSRRNFGVDVGFYPLGSCTMKYNPKINENAARLDGFTSLHPYVSDGFAQGNLQLLYELAGQPLGDLRHGRFHPPAGGGRARRAHGRHGHQKALREEGAEALDDTHPRCGPRNKSCVRGPLRISGGHGAIQCRRGGRSRTPPGADESGRGGAHAHEPQHAGALRAKHRGGGRHRPRQGRASLLRRRQRQCAHRGHETGGSGLRHHPAQSPQDLFHAPRLRRARERARGREGPPGALPARAAGSERRKTGTDGPKSSRSP